MKDDNFILKIISYFNFENELDDFGLIHDNIKKDIVFRGTNLWILMFAIIVASIGLNMNSTAVIIGAMLISPLMGPINGMGYSIAIYDMPLFRQALKNFSFAVFASLAASTTYFFVSPIATAHSELLARTSPTIYDVLIALFGGMAGIIAITSKQKGNVIPGVAIATALMPPLCTAGYGLATAQWEFFLGALFLFTINTVFIALSSVAVAQILKFPISANVAEVNRKRINSLISLVIILVAFPSIYFGYKLVQKERFVEQATRYIESVSIFEGNYMLKSDILPEKRIIQLTYAGISMNDEQKEAIRLRASDFSLQNPEIVIRQGLAIDNQGKEKTETDNLKSQLLNLKIALQQKDEFIDSVSTQGMIGKNILDEIKTIYPQIESCTYTKAIEYQSSTANAGHTDFVVFGLNSTLSAIDKEKIEAWVKARIQSEKIRVIYLK